MLVDWRTHKFWMLVNESVQESGGDVAIVFD